MDIYVKKAIIHQFSPDDTDLYLADKFLNITPKIEEYLRKKIERVYSDEARTGIFEEDNPFPVSYTHLMDELDFLEKNACPTCGSCSGMFTANSMNCLMEVLGLSLIHI